MAMNSWALVLIGCAFAWVGLTLGSFSNVVIYRYPHHMTVTDPPRSFCPQCHRQLAWYDNIPLLSYLLLGGRCRYCRAPISRRYPLVELLGLLAFAVPFLVYCFGYPQLTYVFAFDYRSLLVAFIFLFLLNMAFIDHDTQEVPLGLSIPYAVLCVGLYVSQAVISRDWLPSFLLSFAGLALFLFLLWGCYRLLRNQEALGWGDILVLSFGALATGFVGMLLMLFIASVSFLAFYLVTYRRLAKDGGSTEKLKETPFPFVPFIALGAVVGILAGPVLESLLFVF